MSDDLRESDDLDMLLRVGLRECVGPRAGAARAWPRLRSRIMARWWSQPAPLAFHPGVGKFPANAHVIIHVDWMPEWHLFSLVQIAM